MRKSLSKKLLFFIYIFILGGLILTVFVGNKAVTVLSEKAPLTGRSCVIIDAGHGGVDGGATSCTGILESEINLEIALRLDDLMHLIGLDTVMTRTADLSIHTQGQTIAAKKVSDLKNRVQIVNREQNALLISIHQNYFEDSRYSGAQVFYAPTSDSNTFAKTLQTAFVNTLNPDSNRKAKKASGIYLMEHINCTGVLIECGFISNHEEEAKLRNADYQKKICAVIASQTSCYLQPKPAA